MCICKVYNFDKYILLVSNFHLIRFCFFLKLERQHSFWIEMTYFSKIIPLLKLSKLSIQYCAKHFFTRATQQIRL